MDNQRTMLIYFAAIVLSCWLLIYGLSAQGSSYYYLLRWLVTIVDIALAYKFSFNVRLRKIYLVYVAGAIVFNPAIPLYLSRNVWATIDLTMAVFLASGAVGLFYSQQEDVADQKASAAFVGLWSLVQRGNREQIEFHGHLDTVKMALACGASVESADESGTTPLIFASLTGPLEVVQLLLEAGADVNRKQAGGYTALCGAANCGHAAIVKALLSAGANTNVIGGNGQSPLMSAIAGNETEIVSLLLKAGANPNEKTDHDYSMLHCAVIQGSAGSVDELIKSGADIADSRALAAAASSGYLSIIEIFLRAGAKVNSDVLGSAVHSWETDEVMEWETVDNCRGHGHADIVKLLLAAGCGWTFPETRERAIRLAKQHGRKDILEMIFSPGYDSMLVGDFSCQIHMPTATQSRYDPNGGELVQALPPYCQQPVYPVDAYNKVPDLWKWAGPTDKDYFVVADPGHGIWLDFNDNFTHPHNIAILISVQGINPITGKVSSGRQLEQYNVACPLHGTNFGKYRFCAECGYSWPAQNYLSTAGTPEGLLWLDGFRTSAGVVRQWVITDDAARGIAAQIIGGGRVYAISVSYYLSRVSKRDTPVTLYQMAPTYGNEIAAGAKIKQSVYDDQEGLDFWQPEPAATLFVNYCTSETARQVFNSGLRIAGRQTEGALGGFKVGNP